MRLNIFEDSELQFLLPIDSIPDEIKKIVLIFSGHLRIGKRSVSWLLYF